MIACVAQLLKTDGSGTGFMGSDHTTFGDEEEITFDDDRDNMITHNALVSAHAYIRVSVANNLDGAAAAHAAAPAVHREMNTLYVGDVNDASFTRVRGQFEAQSPLKVITSANVDETQQRWNVNRPQRGKVAVATSKGGDVSETVSVDRISPYNPSTTKAWKAADVRSLAFRLTLAMVQRDGLTMSGERELKDIDVVYDEIENKFYGSVLETRGGAFSSGPFDLHVQIYVPTHGAIVTLRTSLPHPDGPRDEFVDVARLPDELTNVYQYADYITGKCFTLDDPADLIAPCQYFSAHLDRSCRVRLSKVAAKVDNIAGPVIGDAHGNLTQTLYAVAAPMTSRVSEAGHQGDIVKIEIRQTKTPKFYVLKHTIEHRLTFKFDAGTFSFPTPPPEPVPGNRKLQQRHRMQALEEHENATREILHDPAHWCHVAGKLQAQGQVEQVESPSAPAALKNGRPTLADVGDDAAAPTRQAVKAPNLFSGVTKIPFGLYIPRSRNYTVEEPATWLQQALRIDADKAVVEAPRDANLFVPTDRPYNQRITDLFHAQPMFPKVGTRGGEAWAEFIRVQQEAAAEPPAAAPGAGEQEAAAEAPAAAPGAGAQQAAAAPPAAAPGVVVLDNAAAQVEAAEHIMRMQVDAAGTPAPAAPVAGAALAAAPAAAHHAGEPVAELPPATLQGLAPAAPPGLQPVGEDPAGSSRISYGAHLRPPGPRAVERAAEPPAAHDGGGATAEGAQAADNTADATDSIAPGNTGARRHAARTGDTGAPCHAAPTRAAPYGDGANTNTPPAKRRAAPTSRASDDAASGVVVVRSARKAPKLVGVDAAVQHAGVSEQLDDDAEQRDDDEEGTVLTVRAFVDLTAAAPQTVAPLEEDELESTEDVDSVAFSGFGTLGAPKMIQELDTAKPSDGANTWFFRDASGIDSDHAIVVKATAANIQKVALHQSKLQSAAAAAGRMLVELKEARQSVKRQRSETPPAVDAAAAAAAPAAASDPQKALQMDDGSDEQPEAAPADAPADAAAASVAES